MFTKKYAFIFLMSGVFLITPASETRQKEKRQIPVVVTAGVEPNNVKAEESIPLTITISNGLPSSIYHSTFSLVPNNWDGETFNVSLVDVFRDDKTSNLYYTRPVIYAPRTISGMSRNEIKPGGKLVILTDARKWKLRDGWLPGKYKVTARVDNLTVDKYSELSVITDPIEFEIK